MKTCLWVLLAASLHAQEPCAVTQPTATFEIHHTADPGELSLDPQAAMWKNAAHAWIVKDCSKKKDYPNLKTEVRAFWTDTDIYFLFVSPYDTLNLFLPPQNDKPRRGLWDRDVVEIFLGDDWENIRHYREFEIAPTGDWIDLAIDLDRKGKSPPWQSGWKTKAKIDEAGKTWYAAAKIPLASVTTAKIKSGTRWRANLYRIEGQGADPVRHFMCWQETCAGNRDPNHVPENFGTLVFKD